MSIARAWRKDREHESPVESNKVEVESCDVGDRISRKILRMPDVGNLDTAMKALACGLGGGRVTFRSTVTVTRWAKSGRRRETFGDLPECDVEAGARGTTVSVMVDGRDLVKMDDGCEVLAFVGSDCKLLRWWHRLVDRWKGRTFAR